MSKNACHAVCMKNSKSDRFHVSFSTFASRKIIAIFGAARLVRKLDGRHEFIGGTPADHAAAIEWCSLFAHEAVFTSTLMPRPIRGDVAFAA
jgi:hypothetical protein